jgi:hypothetical protein
VTQAARSGCHMDPTRPIISGRDCQ